MDWKPWLRRWSEEWVRSSDPGELDPEVLSERWLGFAGATPEAVATAEERIGRTLPPSYREFLLTTDGWRNAGIFVWRMRDTTDLGWLRDIEPFWEESWEELCEGDNADPENGNKFSRGLMISLEADAGILFLDPGDVDEAGEWAAYSLFSWEAKPPTRFASFTELMKELYAEFHQMRQPPGETRDSWDVKVEQARLEALAGDFEGAGTVLAEAEEFGRSRATVLHAQLQLFLNQYTAGQSLGRLLPPSPLPEGFLAGPLFTEEFLPLLFAGHARTATHGHSSILKSAMIGDRPEVQLIVGEYQARLHHGHSDLSYGNPEFDILIRAALNEHGADPDALWQAVRAAFRHWRPRTADHLAPVVLLADPVLAAILDPYRGRELLSTPRGDR